MANQSGRICTGAGWILEHETPDDWREHIRQWCGINHYQKQQGKEFQDELHTANNVLIAMRDAEVWRTVSSLSLKEKSMLEGIIAAFAIGIFTNEAMDTVWKAVAWGGGKGSFALPATSYPNQVQESLKQAYSRYFLPSEDTYINFLQQYIALAIKHAPEQLKEKLATYMQRGARWFNMSDVEHSIYETSSNNDAVILGSIDGQMIFYGADNQNSLLCIGGAGTGKTTGLVVPSLLWDTKHSAVVLDVKPAEAENAEHLGELYELTAGYREKCGHRIIHYNPLDLKGRTMRFNPLSFVDRNPLILWEQCQEIANLLIPDPVGESNPYFTRQAQSFLTFFVALAILTEDPKKPARFKDVFGWIYLPPELISDYLKNDLSIVFEETGSIAAMQNKANSLITMIDGKAKSYAEIIASLDNFTAKLQGELIAMSMTGNDWTPEDLLSQPTTIYLTITRDLETWSPLLRLIITLHFNALMKKKRTKEQDSITFYLDECAALGNFTQLTTTLDRGRAFGIRCFMYFQTIDQIEKVYQRAGSILDNVLPICYLSPTGETAETLSKWLGEVENVLTSEKTPLATLDELAGDLFRNKVIITAKKERPIKADLFFFYDHMQEYILPYPKLEYKNEVL